MAQGINKPVDSGVQAAAAITPDSNDPTTYADWNEPTKFDASKFVTDAVKNGGWTGSGAANTIAPVAGNSPITQPQHESSGGGILGKYLSNGIDNGQWGLKGFSNALNGSSPIGTLVSKGLNALNPGLASAPITSAATAADTEGANAAADSSAAATDAAAEAAGEGVASDVAMFSI